MAGKSMTAWEKEMEEQADVAVGSLPSSGGGNFIKTAGGQLSLNGNAFPDNQVSCVIVRHVSENSYYEGAYDPENAAPPSCFAFSVPGARDPGKSMAPHEEATEPQSEICLDCPNNEWGSAATGRGKACKNIVRIALLASDCLDSVEDMKDSPLCIMKVPVTSVKGFTSYVKTVADKFRRPPFGVVTEITAIPDPKTQFKISFNVEPKSLIKDAKIFEALMERVEAAKEELIVPYQAMEEEEAPVRTPRRAVGKKKATVKKKKRTRV